MIRVIVNANVPDGMILFVHPDRLRPAPAIHEGIGRNIFPAPAAEELEADRRFRRLLEIFLGVK